MMNARNEGVVGNSTQARLRSVALPAEHGGWGFLLEPALAGLLIAPSAAGVWLSVSALGVFLLHQPLRAAVKDRLKGRRYARTRWAERFAALYGAAALLGLALAWTSAQPGLWMPLPVAAAFSLVQLGYEARNRGRELAPELCGALALGGVAPAILLAGGWTLEDALFVWLIIGIRAATSIVYVRARLRLERGYAVNKRRVIGVHAAALALVSWLGALGSIPLLAAAAMLMLLARAAFGLSAQRRPARPKTIGFREMAFGLATAALVAVGYRLG